MLLSLHGQNKDALAKTRAGAWEYDIVAPYFKCNMTDIMASIGLVQLKRYPSMLKRRREIIEYYNSQLDKLGMGYLKHYTKMVLQADIFIFRGLQDTTQSSEIMLFQRWQKWEWLLMFILSHCLC